MLVTRRRAVPTVVPHLPTAHHLESPPQRRDRYVRYVRYATLRALHAAMEATAVHEVGGAPLLAVNMA